jgi:hypothetical protein
VTVTVNPEPVVANQTPTAICSDAVVGVDFSSSSSVSAATYNVTNLLIPNGLTAGSNNDGVQNGLLSSALNNDSYTNLTSGALNAVYTVVPVTTNGCAGNTFDYEVTVKPEPVVSLQTAETCSDIALNLSLDALVSGSGDTYTYAVSSSNQTSVAAGTDRTTASSANITDTYTNTTGTDVLITYSVTPIGANGCAGDAFDYEVTVNPEPLITTPISIATCSGVAFNATGNVIIDKFGTGKDECKNKTKATN